MKIIVDTREQQPLDFEFFGAEAERRGLKTGDYSVEGLEDKLVIERKRSTGELYMCFGKEWPRFKRELERMADVPHAYLVFEFPADHMDSFPRNSGIPGYRWKYLKMTPKFMRKRMHEIQENFPNVQIVFCENKHQLAGVVHEICERVYNER